MAPLFSIITVTYNAATTLPRTLASIAEQTCDLYETIVVDGASTDGTQEIALASGVKNLNLVSEPDKGIYDAMNKGITLAKGDYVIFLNAGDTFYDADTLQLIADKAMDTDYPGIIYGDTVIVDNDGSVLGPRHLQVPDRLTLDSYKEGMLVCHQAFVVLRKLIDYYDLQYRLSADYDWCIQCIQRSRRNRRISTRPLIRYLNEGMTTRNMRRSLWERYRIMCKYYGTLPTTIRHFKFLSRFIKRNKANKNINQ